MKILIVHNSYRQFGGEDTVVNQEIKAYSKLGFTVDTFLVTNSDLTLLDTLFSFFNLFSALKFNRVIKSFKPDVIHVHNFIFKLSPAILTVIPKNIKVLMTIHNYRFLCPSGTLFHKGEINLDSRNTLGLIRNIFKGVYSNSVFKTAIMACIFRINYLFGTFSRVDLFIFLNPFSQALHKEWRKNIFSKSIVKPNFLIADKPKKTEKKFDLVYVGRLSEEKGIIDILPNLIYNTNLQIIIIGDGPLKFEIENRCANYEHITLVGQQPREKVMEFLSKSKFLIFPSILFEGMPMTIIEAFSCGTPVIARNIGAMKSMIDEGNTGFFYSNTKELNQVLERIKSIDVNTLSNTVVKEYLNKYDEESGLRNLKKIIEGISGKSLNHMMT